MDNPEKEKAKEKASFKLHQDNYSSDYKFLVQRLQSISESISLLETNFLHKEK